MEDKRISLIYHDAYSSPRSTIDQDEQGTDVSQYDSRHIWSVQKESREGDRSALVRLQEQVVCTESLVAWASRLGSRMKSRKYIDILASRAFGLLYPNAIYLVSQRVQLDYGGGILQLRASQALAVDGIADIPLLTIRYRQTIRYRLFLNLSMLIAGTISANFKFDDIVTHDIVISYRYRHIFSLELII
jgi:hypothetical protein